MKKNLVILIGTLFTSTFLNAQIKLPNVIADDMVLQQQCMVQLWGKSAPGKIVTVTTSWDNTSYKATTNNDSIFRIKVRTPKASYQPYTITLQQKEKITLRNILIGEVWLCGGQSNMEQPMSGFINQPTEGSLKDIALSTNSALRVYTMSKRSTIEPQYDCMGSWSRAHPDHAGRFTAVGYYFGKMLQQVLDVPVGLLHVSRGGSKIEAWIPGEYLSEFPHVVLPKTDEDNKKTNQTPTVLFNAMTNAIKGYGIKGMIWYQGESNIDNYQEYPALFATMHKALHDKWNMDFPIYFCQIAPYQYKSADKQYAALMREKQQEIALTQPNTAMAVLMDVGERGSIHPAKKREVGERLSYIALSKSYAMPNLPFSAGVMDSVTFDAEKAIVTFKQAESVGLDARVPLRGFELAGSDKFFYPAKARVVRKDYKFHVEVVSDSVSVPVAVRYGFKDWTEATLFGNNGLPISSFRSDDWDEVK